MMQKMSLSSTQRLAAKATLPAPKPWPKPSPALKLWPKPSPLRSPSCSNNNSRSNSLSRKDNPNASEIANSTRKTRGHPEQSSAQSFSLSGFLTFFLIFSLSASSLSLLSLLSHNRLMKSRVSVRKFASVNSHCVVLTSSNTLIMHMLEEVFIVTLQQYDCQLLENKTGYTAELLRAIGQEH